MSTLIGNGGHARDIRATRIFTRYVNHHRDWDGDTPVTIGINDPQLRAEIARILGVHDLNWTHPDARLFNVDVNYGTHINYGVTATRTTIGHHSTISPGVTICGDVTVGNRVLIGAGATICDRVTIMDDAVVGAGAVVLPETTVGRGETWVGVPARCL